MQNKISPDILNLYYLLIVDLVFIASFLKIIKAFKHSNDKKKLNIIEKLLDKLYNNIE